MRFTKFSVLMLLLVTISACKKDESSDPNSNDLTKGKITFNPSINYGTMTDIEGNVYKTVKIGTQTWMAENLRTKTYNDGTPILNITNDADWLQPHRSRAEKKGFYCNYKNTNNTDTIITYGRLYNWYAVETGKLAPTGWHVPTDSEWTTLVTSLGGIDVAGNKLKETGTKHWETLNSATNESGFTAIPGGYRYLIGSYHYIGDNGYWWSSTEWYGEDARYFELPGMLSNAFSGSNYMEYGYSVRCVKD